MRPDPFFWQLAGPRAFFGRVCDAIERHHDVALGLPHGAPDRLLPSLEGLFEQQTHLRPIFVDVLERETVEDAIQHKLEQDVPTSAWRLASLYDFANEVVLLNAETDAARQRVHAYLTDHSRLAIEERRRGPALLTVLPGTCLGTDGSARPPQGAGAVVWKGVVSATDMEVYVAYRTQNRVMENEPPLVQSYIRCFSGLDPLMTERLLKLSDEDILTLPSAARAWTRDIADLWRSPNWLNGAIETSAGRESLHPLYEIHTADNPAINRRAWTAQVQALFPWLELHREAIVHPELEWIHKLPSPLTKQNGQLYDLNNLEINDVWNIGKWQARKHVDSFLPLITLARKVRNQLAHREPAHPSEIRTLINEIKLRAGI